MCGFYGRGRCPQAACSFQQGFLSFKVDGLVLKFFRQTQQISVNWRKNGRWLKPWASINSLWCNTPALQARGTAAADDITLNDLSHLTFAHLTANIAWNVASEDAPTELHGNQCFRQRGVHPSNDGLISFWTAWTQPEAVLIKKLRPTFCREICTKLINVNRSFVFCIEARGLGRRPQSESRSLFVLLLLWLLTMCVGGLSHTIIKTRFSRPQLHEFALSHNSQTWR